MASLKFLLSPIFLSVLSCWCLGNSGPGLSRAQIINTTDTIKPGEELGYSQHLVSNDGRFQLGFNSTNLAGGYLAIWYTNDDYESKIVHDGDGSPIVLNANEAAPNSTATLENSGNFIVKELNSDRILWQSFDHPTDTLLPGMKLGINLKTQQKWMLTSWVTDKIPAPGGFSLEWELMENGTGQLVMKHRGNMYWVSGVGSNSDFENVGTMTSDWLYYNFSYVSNETERYFSYSSPDMSVSRWVLSSDGALTDNPKPIFVRSGMCFGYSSALGCEPQKTPKCRNSNQKFEKRYGYFSPKASLGFDYNSNISIGDCWAQCWNDCSCVSFDTSTDNKTGCRFTSQFVEDQAQSFPQMNVLIETRPGEQNTWWIWFIVATAAALVVILGFLCFLRRKKLKREQESNEEATLLELTTSNRFGDANEINNDGRKGQDLKVFSFASVVAATNNFSIENKLGQGGFGPVYKGKLPEGQEIAVKRLLSSSGQGLVEFKNELILIAKLQHMNLVRLLGCCVNRDEKMLIYEYMPNKSLDFFLFDPKKRELLDWKRRYNIIEGIAQGLLYLHKYSRLRIIHRDLKASNILLDDDMNPKISDFGMAKVFGRNDAEANTGRVVGTHGYMSPEYIMEGNFSEKSDVYSFGVLILEIVSGQKTRGIYHLDRPMNLVGYAWELWREDRSLELMDSTLVESYSTLQILRCIHVGLLCVQEFAADRPTMSDVISMLTNETMSLPTPKQIAFSAQRQLIETNLPRNERESSSATITISEMDPR
ncbi:G-type lectin S-receptor-like serine/threonine-protein kinase CES101 isoform X2 [Corylus avellana]|uniref:G-type lectin S-receptor-like serine/threonine-protein kinase CES101 isoform X2 n=1 Tax=Corylus avellana TaxID=13451 RepID=UPI00286AB06F|nr:G-type lectin S-receptor-like serine/threonine-protein kinase CES101 isoform X2 [Corylus avellana]